MSACKTRAKLMQNACKTRAKLMPNSCKTRAKFVCTRKLMPNSCKTRAKLVQNSCQIRAKLMQNECKTRAIRAKLVPNSFARANSCKICAKHVPNSCKTRANGTFCPTKDVEMCDRSLLLLTSVTHLDVPLTTCSSKPYSRRRCMSLGCSRCY